MRQVDCAGLLAQDNPDALVLAILCDLGERPAAEVVRDIVGRLKGLLGTEEKGFREYLVMLEVLSENRGLEGEIAEAERMLTRVDVTRLPSYRLGYGAGRDEGREEGLDAERRMVLRLIDRRFGVGTAEAAQPLLARIDRPQPFERVGEWVIDCADAEDFLARLRTLVP